jgi:hypothetical protein
VIFSFHFSTYFLVSAILFIFSCLYIVYNWFFTMKESIFDFFSSSMD